MQTHPFAISLLLMLSAFAAAEAQEAHEVIYDQPAGQLTIYQRHGYTVNENEYTAAITTSTQSGLVSVVMAPDEGLAYIQDPVSGYTFSGAWVRGELSADGTTITLPMGQLVDYTRSFDLGYELQVLQLNADTGKYEVDSLCTSVTYTVSDGQIALNGTSADRILGLIIRAFGHPQGSAIGQSFDYLEGEWLGFGDFESVYMPSDLQAPTPPYGLATDAFYLTTAAFDGSNYHPYSATVRVGYDEDVEHVWIQNITNFLPSAWAMGDRVADDLVVIPSGQFIGTIDGIPLFLHGATLNADNSFSIKDIELNMTERGYTTTDFVFISTSATALEYVTFYMGLTIADEPDRTVEPPVTLTTRGYMMNYAESAGAMTRQQPVQVGIADGQVYVQGLWSWMPDAWVCGAVEGSRVRFALPQFMGTYDDDGEVYPIYLTAFDEQSGMLQPELTFAYDAASGALTDASLPVSIGINKTGYLSVQDYYNLSFTLTDTQGLTAAATTPSAGTDFYDLSGRRARPVTRGLLIDRAGRKHLAPAHK